MVPKAVGWFIAAAVTQCGKASYAHVDADSSLCCRQWIGGFLFCLDRDIPFSGSLADSDVFDFTGDGLAFPVAYPPQFRQVYSVVLFFEFDALWVAKAIPATLTLELRKISSFSKEVFVG